MSEPTVLQAGNILGAVRAEADDRMLDRAFVETPDYRALINTRDFNFVVGRRGTGKSALFKKVASHFCGSPGIRLFAGAPAEHQMDQFQKMLGEKSSGYRECRVFARLVWNAHMLLLAVPGILDHYKARKQQSDTDYLRGYAERHQVLLDDDSMQRVVTLASLLKNRDPGSFTADLEYERLRSTVQRLLREEAQTVIALFDGLDEGWEPTPVSTAVIGGLAKAAADLIDSHIQIHPILFVRDNMFRAVAEFDSDFTRHIEGSTLRLHWDTESLFHLVAERLRVALGLHKIESDVKVWNRFAQRELKERAGFERCLHHTLYRPRDILVLLNTAYQNATRAGRAEIVESDVDSSASRISETRLDDLLKEYNVVLPGLRDFISVFRNSPSVLTLAAAEATLERGRDHFDEDQSAVQDFALLGGARQVFLALYSVGFFGLYDHSNGAYTFCHDGAPADIGELPDAQPVAIHPCYWRALGISVGMPEQAIAVTINDEKTDSTAVSDLRTKRLGIVVGELDGIPEGADGSAKFEQWVLSACQIVLTPALVNAELHPNPSDAVQQRDVVATNMAEQGFWKRIRDDYGTRQVILECKNYRALKPDDFRQVLCYTTGEYGRFALIVNRSDQDILTDHERGWVRELYTGHGRLIMVLPAPLLARCMRKIKNPLRRDYAEDLLSRRMDSLVRNLGERHMRPFRRKKRR